MYRSMNGWRAGARLDERSLRIARDRSWIHGRPRGGFLVNVTHVGRSLLPKTLDEQRSLLIKVILIAA